MAEKPDMQNSAPAFSRIVRFRRISKAAEYEFSESPTEEELRNIAKVLDVLSVRKMRFAGRLIPLDNGGWMLEAALGTTVTQACVITLEPVRTRIDLEIRRQYLPDLDEPMAEIDISIEDEDDIEPLETELDLGLVAMEALALALPDYPKIEGATLDESLFSADDGASGTEEAERPFAGLAALKDKLENNGE